MITYFDNVVIADTLTVVGETSTTETIGTLTITTALNSTAGKIGLGTTPGTTAAINVDGASYSGQVYRAVHGTSDFRIVTSNNAATYLGSIGAHDLRFVANNDFKWKMIGNATGTATLTSEQAIAQIVGGATSTTLYQSNGASIVMQYDASGRVGFGTAAAAQYAILAQKGVTAASSLAVGFYSLPTLAAAANNDVLTNMRLETTHTPGAFTGLQAIGLDVRAFSVAAFTTPGNPIGISVGVITGTGASVATALSLAPPTGATTNYLIAHTTAATFNVTAAGSITATELTVAAGVTAGASSIINFAGRGKFSSPTDGIITLSNNALSDFTRLQFGGTTTSFPSLIRTGISLAVGLGDGTYTGAFFGVGVAASSTTALVVAASVAGQSSLRLPHGTAPSAPVDGDMWTTTAGLFVRINGATVGPLS